MESTEEEEENETISQYTAWKKHKFRILNHERTRFCSVCNRKRRKRRQKLQKWDRIGVKKAIQILEHENIWVDYEYELLCNRCKAMDPNDYNWINRPIESSFKGRCENNIVKLIATKTYQKYMRRDEPITKKRRYKIFLNISD
eukprot:23036_1